MKLSEASPKLAKRVIDCLAKAGKDIEMINHVIHKLERMIVDELLKEKLDQASDEDIQGVVDTIIEESASINESLSEIILSEGGFSEDREYELITTAKQTDSRYGDFSYSKEQLETMAWNFNANVVGTEIPVDLNHDPEHVAYAWLKPGTMKVKESSKLDGHHSLYCQLYKFTPEGKDMISTGKMRYFSLQIQNVFSKFVDNSKKVFNFVIRALALTNMPVIKDMAPTFNELPIKNLPNMEKLEQLEKQLGEITVSLGEKDRMLAEKEAEMKVLSDKLAEVATAARDKELAESVEKLCLSESNKAGFKGGERVKVLAFVKTLSDEQAKTYFAVHQDILTSVDLDEHGETGEGEGATDEATQEAIDKQAKALSEKTGMTLGEAYKEILGTDAKLAEKIL